MNPQSILDWLYGTLNPFYRDALARVGASCPPGTVVMSTSSPCGAAQFSLSGERDIAQTRLMWIVGIAGVGGIILWRRKRKAG